eukprot:9268849-Heterocapsa_arctica.AAC.1
MFGHGQQTQVHPSGHTGLPASKLAPAASQPTSQPASQPCDGLPHRLHEQAVEDQPAVGNPA